MKHILRVLLAAATTVSLVLCVALCGLWGRSYWAGTTYFHVWWYTNRPAGSGWVDAAARSCQIESSAGRFCWKWLTAKTHEPVMGASEAIAPSSAIRRDWVWRDEVRALDYRPPAAPTTGRPGITSSTSVWGWSSTWVCRRSTTGPPDHPGIGQPAQPIPGAESAGVEWHGLLPYWLPAIVTAILPAVRARRTFRTWRRKGRLARGLCVACGYDLRSSPGRCPECGASGEPASPGRGVAPRWGAVARWGALALLLAGAGALVLDGVLRPGPKPVPSTPFHWPRPVPHEDNPDPPDSPAPPEPSPAETKEPTADAPAAHPAGSNGGDATGEGAK